MTEEHDEMPTMAAVANAMQRTVELMDIVIESAEEVSAICYDDNRDLTALAISLWLSSQEHSSTQFAANVKMCVETAYYLGYQAGQKTGDLSEWRRMLGNE